MSNIQQIETGFVVEVPVGFEDFFVSGTGYLCARHPRVQVLFDRKVTELGIHGADQIRLATNGEVERAGFDLSDEDVMCLHLAPGNGKALS